MSLPVLAFAQEGTLFEREMAINEITALEISNDNVQIKVGKDGLNKLYNRFEQHFQHIAAEGHDKESLYNFIMGLESSNKSLNLGYLFNVALDEGLPLDRFSAFGINKVKDKTYSYDLSISPYLATAEQLFRPIEGESSIDFSSHELIRRGFRQIDIEMMKNYVSNHNKVQELLALQISYLDAIRPGLEQTVELNHVINPNYIEQELLKLDYHGLYMRQRVWRNWALGLLATLDLKRQNALRIFLIDNLKSNVTKTANASGRSLAGRIAKIKTKNFGQQLKEKLNKNQKEQ